MSEEKMMQFNNIRFFRINKIDFSLCDFFWVIGKLINYSQ